MSALWQRLEGPVGELRYYVTAGDDDAPRTETLLVCHELPHSRGAAANVGATYPELADRLAEESGWRVSAATLRGAGESEGEFSPAGWLEDVSFVFDHAIGPDERGWVVGFGFGGVLALRLAAQDPRVRGVACLGTPADLSGAITDPTRMLAVCRESGVVRRALSAEGLASWSSQLADLDPLGAAASLGDRCLLLIHGADDDQVPTAAARAFADVALGPVELRLVPAAGHWLRADPRVLASLIGWLARQH